MYRFIIETILPLIGAFFVGAIGWWITHWIARPILEIERARRETYALWRSYQHASKDWANDKIVEATDKLSAMAAYLDAIQATSAVSRWYCRRVRGWNLTEVQAKLRSLSNVRGITRDERTVLWHELQQAFRLPLRDTSERIERIRDRIGRSDA